MGLQKASPYLDLYSATALALFRWCCYIYSMTYDYRGRAKYASTSEEVSELRGLADKLFALGQDDLAHEALGVAMHVMARTITGSLPPGSLLQNLIQLLNDNDCSYAVIGGLAVNVHGTPRGTDDINLLVDKFPEQTKLSDSAYMARFGFYKAKSATGTVLQIGPRQGNGYVELLQANTDLFRWALRGAKPESILHTTIPVITPHALIALKAHAIKKTPSRIAKDAPDILSVVHTSHVTGLETKIKGQISDDEWGIVKQIVPPSAL